ncbi:penicillin-binding transpeptidase domain-containing protein [Prosthecobacter sp.]|uniref:penicillin-binding transpeptidase domain-containing protein n=1 Tax=Prosthecobacter sp. TaxID=1965333 RepID=UPI0037851C85
MNTVPLLDLLSHTALKGSAVLLVALLLGLLLRTLAASRRYALWITAVIALAVLPFAMGVLPAWRVLPKAAANLPRFGLDPAPAQENENPKAMSLPAGTKISFSAPAYHIGPSESAQAEVRSSTSWNNSWQEVVSVLPVAWMFVAGMLLLRLGVSAWRLRRLERTLRPGKSEALEDAARELGLKRLPRLVVGPADSVPMVWGVFSPRLLLPEGFENWSAETQRGVLLHELAHLKRGDPLALWAAQWVKALHWFNPLAWLTLRQLRADQERACDDAVLRNGVRASEYAQSLLDLSRHNRIAPGLSLCALTITRCAPVEARVKAILDPTRHRETVTLRWLAGMAACALLITLPVAMLHAIEGTGLRGRILDRHGMVLAESTKEKVRSYPYKTLAAHVLGYTGRASKDDETPTGRDAMERQQEDVLRQGRDVSLTLDMRVQALTTRAMMEGGFSRGAAVVLDPLTGEILAAVSLPSFDPNCFIPRISAEDFQAYSSHRDLPLFSRCLRGSYPPAAAFTPLTALAGFSAGLRDEHYTCKGSITYGTRIFRCWKGGGDEGGHGMLDLKGAMVSSCNCYWYQFGNATGLDAFGRLFTALGFDKDYDLLPGEAEATLPPLSDGKKGSGSPSQAEMASLSIGQGRILLSPLHMGMLAATVANGGKVSQPVLVKGQAGTAWRADLAEQGITSESIALLRQSMRAVVNDPAGTGHAAKSDKVVIAAKTGTAQWKLSSNQMLGLMIGFAPYDEPRIAFALVYEGSRDEVVSGGKNCGPVVKRIVEETLALPVDGSGEVKPVEDEIGREHEKLLQAQARFDAQSVQITQEVVLSLKPLEDRLEVKKVTVARGRLTIAGEAADIPTALQVLHLLPKIGKQWVIGWNFPVPRPLPDGKRVEFRAEGVCTAAAEKDAAVQPKGKVTNAMDADIVLDPELAERWRLLKKRGHLADLPVKAVIPPKPEGWMNGTSPFQFTAAREAVKAWLAGSLGEAARQHYEKQQPWPEKPGAFEYTYEGSGDCVIHLKTLDAETIEVRLWLQSKGPKRILIAPDEAPPPAPKTAVPQELPGVVESVETLDGLSATKLRGEIPREVKHLAAKTGVALSGFKNEAGKVTLFGSAAEPEDAHMFGELLKQSGQQGGVAWQMTTPRHMPGESGLKFMVLGFDRTDEPLAASSVRTPAAPAVLPPMSNWETLQRFGKLADLPGGFKIDKVIPEESAFRLQTNLVFAFTAPRGAVREWLSASLPPTKRAAQAEHLRALGSTEPFQHAFWALDRCTFRVKCTGEEARVLISRSSSIFQIAPDEFQQPRPAGRLAPDYQQENLTQLAPPPPTWNTSLHHLRSQVYPDEEKPLPWFIFSPVQFSFEASDPPARDFSDDNLLLSVTQIGKRADQSLLVRLPLPR